MWACPTGASSTSPSHCECRAWPPPFRLLLCLSGWFSTRVGQLLHPLWDQPLLSRLLPDIQPLSRKPPASSGSRVQRGSCACMPGIPGKPGARTEWRQLWQGGRALTSCSAPSCTVGTQLHSGPGAPFTSYLSVLQRVQSLPSLFLLFSSVLILVSTEEYINNRTR